jgi:ATP-binding cassette subfamily F protein uup
VVFGYFSQKGLDTREDKRVIEYVRNIAENFPLADGTKVSAGQFLQLFQFQPEQQFTYISKLSGGEKRRLQLLAILFANPNFLVLDEPTNDLDLVTLTVLEEFLEQYQGCVIIVSHDRYFMDKLVDHLFVFEGDGVIGDFPGNYSEWRRSILKPRKSDEPKKAPVAEVTVKQTPKPRPEQPKQKRKISFKEKHEFETLEKEIPELERLKVYLNDSINSGTLPYEELNKAIEQLADVSNRLGQKEIRWLELSELVAQA